MGCDLTTGSKWRQGPHLSRVLSGSPGPVLATASHYIRSEPLLSHHRASKSYSPKVWSTALVSSPSNLPSNSLTLSGRVPWVLVVLLALLENLAMM